jgi:hypothetical protein
MPRVGLEPTTPMFELTNAVYALDSVTTANPER